MAVLELDAVLLGGGTLVPHLRVESLDGRLLYEGHATSMKCALPGSMWIRASARCSGYVDDARTLYVRSHSERLRLELRCAARILFSVQAESGEPVRAARVTLTPIPRDAGTPFLTATTDEVGLAEFADLRPEPHWAYAVKHASYAPVSGRIQLRGADGHRECVRLNAAATLRLAASGDWTGRESGISVSARSEGRAHEFSVQPHKRDPMTGEFALGHVHAGRTYVDVYYHFHRIKKLDITLGVDGYTIVLDRDTAVPPHLDIRVCDPTGVPIAGADLRVSSESALRARAFSDAEGMARIVGDWLDEAPSVEVHAQKSGYLQRIAVVRSALDGEAEQIVLVPHCVTQVMFVSADPEFQGDAVQYEGWLQPEGTPDAERVRVEGVLGKTQHSIVAGLCEYEIRIRSSVFRASELVSDPTLSIVLRAEDRLAQITFRRMPDCPGDARVLVCSTTRQGQEEWQPVHVPEGVTALDVSVHGSRHEIVGYQHGERSTIAILRGPGPWDVLLPTLDASLPPAIVELVFDTQVSGRVWYAGAGIPRCERELHGTDNISIEIDLDCPRQWWLGVSTGLFYSTRLAPGDRRTLRASAGETYRLTVRGMISASCVAWANGELTQRRLVSLGRGEWDVPVTGPHLLMLRDESGPMFAEVASLPSGLQEGGRSLSGRAVRDVQLISADGREPIGGRATIYWPPDLHPEHGSGHSPYVAVRGIASDGQMSFPLRLLGPVQFGIQVESTDGRTYRGTVHLAPGASTAFALLKAAP